MMIDNDGNWVGDEIIYFKDGENEPVIKTHPEKSGAMIESVLAAHTAKALGLLHGLVVGELDVSTFKTSMIACMGDIRASLRNILAAYKAGQSK